MSLEEIRKFLREHGLEAVPAGPPAATLADFMSWSPSSAAPVFFDGSFPDGVTDIYCAQFSASTAKFSDAFSALTALDLENSALANLIVPAGLINLSLNGASAIGPLNCVLPAGLQSLALVDSLYTSLPALPAALQTLILDAAHLDDLPDLSGTALQALSAVTCPNLSDLPALPATLQSISCNGTLLNSLPAIPAACVSVNFGNCELDSATIDGLLAQLVANGAHGGTVICDGGNDAPSAAGIASANTLVARSWLVATN